MDEQLLEKIGALLRLGHSTVNEHEASLAMEKAQELLLKHGLTMAQVEAGDQHEQAQSATGLDRWLWDNADWKQKLIYDLSRAYLCRSLATSTYVNIIGRPENIAICEQVWNWIVPAVEAMCMVEYALQPTGTRRGWRGAWLQGCASRLADRLRVITENRPSDETALVVAHERENDLYANKYFHPVHGPRARVAGNTSAYLAGMAAGGKMGLGNDKQLAGGAPRLNSGR